MRKAILTVHLYLGLYFGFIILLASLTGTILLFREEIDTALNSSLLKVEPQENQADIEQSYRNVAAHTPESGIRYIRFFEAPDKPIEFWLTGEEDWRAYADPYTGQYTGIRNVDKSLTGILFRLHSNLFAGIVGNWILGITGIALVILCSTGLYLWWPGITKIKTGLMIALRSSWRRMNYDLHRAGGFWTSACLLLFALTGSALVWYSPLSNVLHTITDEEQIVASFDFQKKIDKPQIKPDRAITEAARAIRDGQITFIYLPQSPGQPITVRIRTPGELHPNGRSYVYLHPGNYQVLGVEPASESTMASRFMNILYPLHIGSFGGIVIRICYAIFGIAPGVLTISGFFIWFVRKRRIRSGQRQRDNQQYMTGNDVPHERAAEIVELQ